MPVKRRDLDTDMDNVYHRNSGNGRLQESNVYHSINFIQRKK